MIAGISECHFFWQSKSRAVHTALGGDVSDVVERKDHVGAEGWVGHGFADALDEEVESFFSFLLEGEAINVDQRERDFFFIGTEPDFFVSFVKGTDEAVKELDGINGQVHVTVVKSQEVFGDGKLFWGLVFFVYQHAKEDTCIHVKGKNSLINLVELDIAL